jgi:hypothetical protein
MSSPPWLVGDGVVAVSREAVRVGLTEEMNFRPIWMTCGGKSPVTGGQGDVPQRGCQAKAPW